jgi:putative DNA methylase
VLDPFCGGGSIPLEAQRLGLEAHASDLNPVAVLITKALIEIPPKFAGLPPVNPQDRERGAGAACKGAAGLAADVRYYGKWMRDEAEQRIGHLYPKAKLPDGSEATVIAWLWARTVKCPNPACGAQMPLVRSFALSTKPGKQAWVEPQVDRSVKPPTVGFEVKTGSAGTPPDGSRQRGQTVCLACGGSMTDSMLRARATQSGMREHLMAIVTKGSRGRVYLNAHAAPAPLMDLLEAEWLDQPMSDNTRWFSPPGYGLATFKDLFTPRQLVALTTFSELIGEAWQRVLADGGEPEYADAVATYLAFGLSKASSRNCTLAIWETGMDRLAGAFGRQAIPMTWDYAETNPLAGAGGDIQGTIESVCEVLDRLKNQATGHGFQADAASMPPQTAGRMISTDPPYYDNIGYADLSDFFYIWLRRSLQDIYPDHFSTVLVPKAQELVATPYRFKGGKKEAEQFFEKGLRAAFVRLHDAQAPNYPMTVYYAFKQAESEADGNGTAAGTASTGWETMLEGLVGARFQITGTWPMRSELSNRMVASGTNALASSIVLVCRPLPEAARAVGRAEFLHALGGELPDALHALVSGGVAPVDLQQAAIGPGMAVYSRYPEVQKADGSRLTVREALKIINDHIDGYFRERESDYDAETRWALVWLEQYGFREGPFGEAQDLARAKVTAPNALERAGLVDSGGGRVKLWRPERLLERWQDNAEPFLQHPTLFGAAGLLAALLDKEGRGAAADAVLQLNPRAGEMPALLAELFLTAEKAGERAAAGLYNQLAIEWAGLADESVKRGRQGQERLL